MARIRSKYTLVFLFGSGPISSGCVYVCVCYMKIGQFRNRVRPSVDAVLLHRFVSVLRLGSFGTVSSQLSVDVVLYSLLLHRVVCEVNLPRTGQFRKVRGENATSLISRFNDKNKSDLICNNFSQWLYIILYFKARFEFYWFLYFIILYLLLSATVPTSKCFGDTFGWDNFSPKLIIFNKLSQISCQNFYCLNLFRNP